MNSIPVSIFFDSNYIEAALITAFDLLKKNYKGINKIYLIFLNRSTSDDFLAMKIISDFQSTCKQEIEIVVIIVDDSLPQLNKYHFNNSIVYKPLIPELINNEDYILNIDAGIITGEKFKLMVEKIYEIINSTNQEWIVGAHCEQSVELNLRNSIQERHSLYPVALILLFNTKNFKKANYYQRYLELYKNLNESLTYAEQELMCLTLSTNELIEIPFASERFTPNLSIEAMFDPNLIWKIEEINNSVYFKIVGTLKPWKYWILDPNKKIWLEKVHDLEKIIKLSGNSLIEKNRHDVTHESYRKAFIELQTKLILNFNESPKG